MMEVDRMMRENVGAFLEKQLRKKKVVVLVGTSGNGGLAIPQPFMWSPLTSYQ